MTASFLSDPMAAKADALRSVYNPGERSFFFGHDGSLTGRGYFLIGEKKRGWQKEVRRFDRSTVARPAIKAFIDNIWTAAVLATVAAYAIARRGEIIATIVKAEPDGGIPQTIDEISFRFLGGKRLGTFVIPGVIGPVITSGGDYVIWG